jgi:elongation factor G
MFLNKLDRPGASFRGSLQSILAHRLHPKPMPLVLPIASFDPDDYSKAEPGIQGVVDLVKWEVWKWNEEGESSRHPLPDTVEALAETKIFPPTHPIIPHLVPARTALLENLSMFSEELMERLLDLPSGPSAYLSVSSSDIMPHLRACTLRNDVLPVLCGAAMKHIGTNLVLDYAGELLADPLSVSVIKNPQNAPIRMLAWKVTWDKRKGWMTFVRIYSGTVLHFPPFHKLTTFRYPQEANDCSQCNKKPEGEDLETPFAVCI